MLWETSGKQHKAVALLFFTFHAHVIILSDCGYKKDKNPKWISQKQLLIQPLAVGYVTLSGG